MITPPLLRILVLSLLGLAAARADPAPPAEQILPEEQTLPATTPEPPPKPPHDPVAEERASLLRIGATKLESGDAESALIAYRRAAEITDEPGELAVALLGLARAYRLGDHLVKAAATYERFLKDHPADPDTPSALLELGRTLRSLGSPKLALSRFYSVLHTTLKLPAGSADDYRRIVRTAQFEIAETHLATGNYDEAARLFERLDLLDLAPADRARARFKAARCRVLSGDHPAAIASLEGFIGQEPDDEHNPEARFLLATLFGQLDRPEDALRVTLDLLHHQHDRHADTTRWRVWQRRTGNQLANQFYTHGEFNSALVLYQALAALDDTPAWRLPILYQVALCQERLMQNGDAVATYRTITSLVGDTPGDHTDLARMSVWRIEQLTWWTRAHDEFQALSPPAPPALPDTPALPTPPADPLSS